MSDPLQRMAVAVTPAVMVSACGLLALGLDNQAGRMATRLRDLARELRDLPAGHRRRAPVRAQMGLFARRHQLLAHALLCDYAALLSFVLASALSLAQGPAAGSVAARLPLLCFALGVFALACLALLALASLYLSRAALRIELAWADEGGEPGERAAAGPAG
jgi:hypothetical protein